MVREKLRVSPTESSIDFEGVSAEALQCVLEFCYTGTCTHLNYTNALSVLKASVLLAIDPLLVQLCEQTIVQGMYTKPTPLPIFLTSHYRKSFPIPFNDKLLFHGLHNIEI
jgi:hypothetical protein